MANKNNSKYNWDEWFSRRRFTLVRGRDYRCPTSIMIQQVRNQAWQRGASVTIVEDSKQFTVIVVQSQQTLA